MIRVIGGALLVAGCGGFGFSMAAAQRREQRLLRQLIRGLQEMEWELKYRLTDLPELCRVGGIAAGGILKIVFQELADKLERREAEEISGCLNWIVQQQELPISLRRNLRLLGQSLGRFDLEGQLQGLEQVRQQCTRDLERIEQGSAQRLRSYQTLALCAGAALAILFI